MLGICSCLTLWLWVKTPILPHVLLNLLVVQCRTQVQPSNTNQQAISRRGLTCHPQKCYLQYEVWKTSKKVPTNPRALPWAHPRASSASYPGHPPPDSWQLWGPKNEPKKKTVYLFSKSRNSTKPQQEALLLPHHVTLWALLPLRRSCEVLSAVLSVGKRGLGTLKRQWAR